MHTYTIPDGPIHVLYNHQTDQLGLSAPAWELVAVINFVPFVRYKPDPEDFEQYDGDDDATLGYVPLQGVVFKSSDWTYVGEF